MKLELQVLSAGTPPRVVTIHPPRAMLGRAAACAVVIEHDTVSLEHAELRVLDGRWQLHQRSGRNATLVDGKPAAAEPVPLRDRGLLRLGEVIIEYQLIGEDQKAGPREPAGTTHVPVTMQAVPLKDALARMEPIRGVAASEVHDLPTMILPRIPASPGSAPSSRGPSGGQVIAGYKPDDTPVTVANPQRRSGGPSPLQSRAEQRQPADPAPATLARIPRPAPEAQRAGSADPDLGPDPQTRVNPLRGYPPPASSAHFGSRANAVAPEAAPSTRMNLPRLPAGQSRASGPSPNGATAPAQDAPSRSDPPLPRSISQPPDPLRSIPEPSAPDRKRLEQQVAQLLAEAARLHKENDALKETKAALEAKLARVDARSQSGSDGATPKRSLSDGLSLLEPFAASLKEATELLETREPERARKLLREASFQLAELRYLFTEGR